MGNRKAVEILDRFAAIVREAANRWTGLIVKQIGDAFMLVFEDPQSAVGFALDVERGVQSEPNFPAVQAGVHWGPALYQDGDYIGSAVNLAARLADAAERHEVLVSADVCRSAGALAHAEFVPAGRRRLKGIAEEVEVFRVHSTSYTPAPRRIDPVCGMEVMAGEEAARLNFEGAERVFCSETCLRRFVAAPENYR